MICQINVLEIQQQSFSLLLGMLKKNPDPFPTKCLQDDECKVEFKTNIRRIPLSAELGNLQF